MTAKKATKSKVEKKAATSKSKVYPAIQDQEEWKGDYPKDSAPLSAKQAQAQYDAAHKVWTKEQGEADDALAAKHAEMQAAKKKLDAAKAKHEAVKAADAKVEDKVEAKAEAKDKVKEEVKEVAKAEEKVAAKEAKVEE